MMKFIKTLLIRLSGNRGGDWCEIIYSDKSKETWNIYPVDIPKTEKICVTYKTGTDIVYFITKKELTIETIKLGKGSNPILLEQKYIKKFLNFRNNTEKTVDKQHTLCYNHYSNRFTINYGLEGALKDRNYKPTHNYTHIIIKLIQPMKLHIKVIRWYGLCLIRLT